MRKLIVILSFCALHVSAQTNEFGYPVAPNMSSADTGIPFTSTMNYDVTAMGGAAFSFPIKIPKGLPGVEPSISINYNSQAGNGIVGYGSNISGLSVISVVPRDKFHDGTASGCRWNGTDAFSLDGVRLILKEGTYGANGSVYSLESSSYSRIILHRTDVNGVVNIWFEYTDKDGVTYTYGNTSDSRQDFVGHDGIRRTNSWYVNRVQNSVGNYMTYSYIQDSLYVYPSIIRYGMNTTNASLVNTITFNYQDRVFDRDPFMISDAKGALCKVLYSIVAKTGETTFMTYIFEYETDGQNSAQCHRRLSKINVGGIQKPFELTWNMLPEDQNTVETLNLSLPREAHILTFLSSPHFFTGDINGDGISDIVEHINVCNGTTPYNHFYIFMSESTQQGIHYGNPLKVELPGDFHVNWGTDCSLSPMCIDYDGDGLKDIIIPRIQNSSGALFYYYILYGKDICNGDLDSIMHVCYTLTNSTDPPLYNSSDFNNDGISDIVVMETEGQSNVYRCCVFEGTKNHNDHVYTIHSLSLPSAPKHLFVSDYNGDGMTDLMVVYEDGYKIFWNKSGITTTIFSNSYSYSGTNITDGFRILDGDFNGDGLTDFIVNPDGDMDWEEYLNQGDGSFVFHYTHSFPFFLVCNNDADKENYRAITADLNGDGKSDLVVTKAMYDISGNFQKTYTCWRVSNRFSHNQKYLATSIKESDAKPGYFTVGDFHGLGRMELMNYGYNCLNSTDANVSPQIHVYPVVGRTAATGNIASIKDGLKRTTSFAYKSMIDPAIYSKGISDYPVISCTLPVCAVSTMTSDQGSAGLHTTVYTYQDLKAHVAGRGLIGMGKVIATDAQQGITAEQGFTSIDNSFYIPTSTYLKTTTISDGKYTLRTLNSTLSASGNAYAVSSTSQSVTDFDGLITQNSTTFDTSTHGHVLGETTTSEQHSKSVTYQYTFVGGAYRPNAITYTQKHADDASTYSYVDTYEYNSQGLLTSQVSFSDKSRPQTTSFGYDNYGNVTSKCITGVAGEMLPTEHYEYDATNRFVIHRYSSSQLPSYTYSYDAKGHLLTESIVRGNNTSTTTHSYNAAGMETSVIRPDGTKTTYTYGWGSTPQSRYYILRQGHAEPWVKTWYDNCGREVLTESVGPMGITVRKAITYNNKGQITDTNTEEGNRHIQRFYTYDAQGRILSEQPTAGHGVSYSYSKLKTIITESGLTTTKTFDPWGNLKSSQQGTVTLNYKYNSQGLPVSVYSSADYQRDIIMQYDDMGCRSQLTDADAGTINYSYDGLNRLVSQTDARGKTITSVYNSLGQLESKTIGSSTTTYTYYTSGNGMGQLASSVRSSYTLGYAYDIFGRISSETRQDGSNSYTYSFLYNQGHLSSKTYPLNVTEQLEYDAYGFMSRQKVSGQTVWERTSATGLIDQYALGGGLLIRRDSYNDLGLLTETKTSPSNSSTPLFKMSFVYNSNSSLTQRTLFGQSSEDYTYDSYDRLLSATAATGTQTFTYKSNGNIESKTDIGQYYYDPTKVHAVTGVDNTAGLIPQTPMNITYTDDGKVRYIDDNNLRKGRFYYGPDGERWLATVYGTTINFLGDVEYITGNSNHPETWFYYLSNDVLYVKRSGVQDSVYYVCRDNLGSVMRIMDVNGRQVFDATYDAWGRQTVNRNDINFFRGYTGHQMINEAGLIHMNGRVYDPLLGRFLSPDNYVQLPDNPQNLNRYSYCLNNPLKYNDPSGELFGIDDFLFIVAGGALVGGVLNIASNTNNIKSIGDFFGYFGVGALAGGVGAALSTVSFGVGGALGGALTGLTSGAASGFILGGGNSVLQNGNLNHFFGDALSMATTGAISGAIIGGIVGGLSAHSEGKNFWTGRASNVSGFGNEIDANSISNTSNVERVNGAVSRNANQSTYAEENYLYHYTNEKGYNQIMESQELHPSVGYKHARYGDGVYLTDLNSSDFTRGQLSYKLYKVPYNYRKVQYFLKIDIRGLNVIENIPHNFFIPGNNSLPLQGRIIDGGISVFKIKF